MVALLTDGVALHCECLRKAVVVGMRKREPVDDRWCCSKLRLPVAPWAKECLAAGCKPGAPRRPKPPCLLRKDCATLLVAGCALLKKYSVKEPLKVSGVVLAGALSSVLPGVCKRLQTHTTSIQCQIPRAVDIVSDLLFFWKAFSTRDGL